MITDQNIGIDAPAALVGVLLRRTRRYLDHEGLGLEARCEERCPGDAAAS